MNIEATRSRQGEVLRASRPAKRRAGVLYESSVDQYFHAAQDFDPLPSETVVVLVQTMSRGRVAEAVMGMLISGNELTQFVHSQNGEKKREEVAEDNKRRLKHDAPVAKVIAQSLIEKFGLKENIEIVLGEPLLREKINKAKTIEVSSPGVKEPQKVSLRDTITNAELEKRQEVAGLRLKRKVTSARQKELLAQLDNLVENGVEARKKVIEHNVKLVPFFIRRNKLANPEHMDDLIANGNEGLIRAVELFDWRRGFTFSAYPEAYILQKVKRGNARLRGESPYRSQLWTTIGSAEHELREASREEGEAKGPTDEEIAKKIGITPNLVAKTREEMHLIRSIVSLDRPVEKGKEETVADLMGSVFEPGYEEVMRTEDLKRIFAAANLTEVEKQVFVLRALDEMTPQEIQEEYGLTKSGVLNAFRLAQKKLQKAATTHAKAYFGLD